MTTHTSIGGLGPQDSRPLTVRLQVPTRVSRSRTSTASGTDGPLTQVLPPPALPAQSRQGYWRGRYKPRYNAEAVPVDLRDDCGRGVDVGPFPAASAGRTNAAETDALVPPTCTTQRISPVHHGQPCDRQHETTRSQYALEQPTKTYWWSWWPGPGSNRRPSAFQSGDARVRATRRITRWQASGTRNAKGPLRLS